MSRTSPCTHPAVLLHISACLLARPGLRLPSGLAGSLKLFALLPTLPGTSSPSTVPFCASPFLAPPPPRYPFTLPALSSALLLGKMAFLGPPLPSDPWLFSVTASLRTLSLFQCPFPGALCPAPSPDISLLTCMARTPLLSKFPLSGCSYPVPCVFYFFLPVLCFSASSSLFQCLHFFGLLSLFLIFCLPVLNPFAF